MQIDREGAAPEEPADPRRPLVLAGVAGFTIGATVIGLLWGLSGSADGAAEDARAACAALSRAGPLPPTYTAEAALGAGVVRHIVAARELATAASEENSLYQDLADHLDGVSRMVISLNFAALPAGGT
jgi:hypothetical protein